MIKINKSNFVIYFILSQLFIFSYPFQLFGIITITETNLFIAVEVLIFILIRHTNYRFSLKSHHIWLFLLFIYIGFSSIYINPASVKELLGYELFVIYPLLSLVFLDNFVVNIRNGNESAYIFLFLLMIIQLPVMLFQIIGASFISSIAKVPIEPIDMVSGTFFLKSDSSLVLFSELFIASILFGKARLSAKDNIILVTATVIVFLSNSFAGMVVYFFIIFMYLMSRAWKNIYSPFTLMMLILTAVSGYIVIDQVIYLFVEHAGRILDSNYLLNYGDSISRQALIGLAFNDDLLVFGHGLYDYYNYITKEWKYMGGHSLLFSLYNDIGIVGIIMLLMVYWFLIHRSIRVTYLGIVYYFMLINYSLFNVLLYDFGALILVVYFVRVLPIYFAKGGNPLGYNRLWK